MNKVLPYGNHKSKGKLSKRSGDLYGVRMSVLRTPEHFWAGGQKTLENVIIRKD